MTNRTNHKWKRERKEEVADAIISKRLEKGQHPEWLLAAQGFENKTKCKRSRMCKRKSRGKDVRRENC